MNLVQRLLDGNQRFLNSTFKQKQHKYEELAIHGQSPKILIIACCDSRVTPEAIFDFEPGELFVVRNVANLVPAFHKNSDECSTGAAIEFAVNALKVSHVIVLGHANCGGIKAFLANHDSLQRVGEQIGSWIKHLTNAYDSTIQVEQNESTQQEKMEIAGIQQSLDNLKTYPFMQPKIESGEIELLGAWYNILNGEVRILN